MNHFPHLAAHADEKTTRDRRPRLLPLEAERDLAPLIDGTIADVTASVPAPDAVLGDYVGLASLIRSLSFHEGKLLERAMIALGQRNSDLVILSQSLRLPVTPAALEAIARNRSGRLKGLAFDAEARTRMSYTPDLIVVNRARHTATVIDMKRSVASYLDTNRLEDLKRRMLAVSLILPDWLYREHQRLMVDEVGIAIVDGASAPSDHDAGIWALDEIDDLLEIDGAAAAMQAMRTAFGERMRELLKAEAERVVGAGKDQDEAASARRASRACSASRGNGSPRDGDQGDCEESSGAEMISAMPPSARMIRVGVARPRVAA